MLSFEELKEYEGIGEKIANNIIKKRNQKYFENSNDIFKRVKHLPKNYNYKF